MATMLGGDPVDLPEDLVPLYRLDDRADLIAVLPVFDERGLLPAEGSGPVEVSSSDTPVRGIRRRPSMTARRARLSCHMPPFCASLKVMMPLVRSPWGSPRSRPGPPGDPRRPRVLCGPHACPPPKVRGWVIIGGSCLRWWRT